MFPTPHDSCSVFILYLLNVRPQKLLLTFRVVFSSLCRYARQFTNAWQKLHRGIGHNTPHLINTCHRESLPTHTLPPPSPYLPRLLFRSSLLNIQYEMVIILSKVPGVLDLACCLTGRKLHKVFWVM